MRALRSSPTLAAITVTEAPRAAASSASAKPMRPELRLPTKRTESIGSRVPPAGQRRLDGLEQLRRLGEAADAPLALGAERADAGVEHRRPALAQDGEV